MNEPTIDSIIEILKRALKARGWRYRDLGAALGLSESGVKKVMAGDGLSVARLLRICAALDVAPTDVLAAAPKRALRLTEAQEAFFLANPATFHVFRGLLDLGLDVDAVRRRFGLDWASMRAYLGELSRLDLLVLLPDDHVRLRQPGPWSLQMGSRLGAMVVGGVQRALLAHAQARHATHGGQQELGLGQLRLSTRSLDALRADMRALLERYARTSRREALEVSAAELVEVGVLGVVAPFSVQDAVEVPRRAV